MFEVKDHYAYRLLEKEYDRVFLDYVILSCNEYAGFDTHKKAVIKAFEILNERYSDTEFSVEFHEEKMAGQPVSAEVFFSLPLAGYDESKEKERGLDIPKPLPYWFAFLEPPQGNPYRKSDFIAFNEALFPDMDSLEIFRWNDEFSDYFDAGKEWWGTGLWSIYDPRTKQLTVIGASLSD